MADVFLSYKREDRPIAERVAAGITAHGLSVWWDDQLTARTAWDAEIQREITAAPAVAVLWTPRSVESEWVRTEAHYGLERQKLVPVMVEPCAIPLAFRLRQTVNLSDWTGDPAHRQWEKLLAWLSDLVNGASEPSGDEKGATVAGRNARGGASEQFFGEPVVEGAFVTTATPAGTAFRDASGLPIMRVVPSGAFSLGSPPTDRDRSVTEGPQKRVEIPQPFAMGVFPVLVGEYAAPGEATPTHGLPVTNVSFGDANAFAQKLSEQTGQVYRLPSEAEWEYACRAGSRTRYAFGDLLDPGKAVFGRTAGPAPVGSSSPNAFGLFDMHGNVREWTADLWHETYDSTPLDGSPALDGHGSMRVVRGGGWSDGPPMLRSAARMRATESIKSAVIGFRLVRAIN